MPILGFMIGGLFGIRKFSQCICQKTEVFAISLFTREAHPGGAKSEFCKICVFSYPNILQKRKNLAKNVAFSNALCYNVAAIN